jgi:hypothetical protein
VSWVYRYFRRLSNQFKALPRGEIINAITPLFDVTIPVRLQRGQHLKIVLLDSEQAARWPSHPDDVVFHHAQIYAEERQVVVCLDLGMRQGGVEFTKLAP